MDFSQYAGLASVPVIIALVAMVRSWLKVPTEFAPVVAVLLGVVWNLAVAPLVKTDMYPAVLLGVIAGLASAGLYDFGKKGLDVLER